MARPTLEAAVTSALPEGKEAYLFEPLLLWHTNGKCYGVLGGANLALAWQRGADAKTLKYFYLTDANGERVVVKDQPRYPGHAYAILEALDRAERSNV